MVFHYGYEHSSRRAIDKFAEGFRALQYASSCQVPDQLGFFVKGLPSNTGHAAGHETAKWVYAGTRDTTQLGVPISPISEKHFADLLLIKKDYDLSGARFGASRLNE